MDFSVSKSWQINYFRNGCENPNVNKTANILNHDIVVSFGSKLFAKFLFRNKKKRVNDHMSCGFVLEWKEKKHNDHMSWV